MRIFRWTSVALMFSMPLAACSSSEVDEQSPAVPASKTAHVFKAGDQASAQRAEELSLRHLLDTDPALLDGVAEVWAKQVRVDKFGKAHTRILQTVDNIPVFGGQSVVHLNADGSFASMTDKFIRHLAVDTKPRYTDFEAIDFAVDGIGGWKGITGTPQADLQILRHQGKDHLTYRVQLQSFEPDREPSMPVIFIDAHTGDIVWQYDNLKTSRDRRTYTANNGSSIPGSLVRTEGDGPSGDVVLDTAHDNAGYTYDYYAAFHGRDSFDGNGATIHSTVHYGSNYVNAFWNGSQMVYGDGNGVDSDPLVVLDVVGHELTHAVTDYSSDLIYSNESGALNEAMSDIFGAAIEAYRDGAVSANTFLVGEACWTPGEDGDALRYMHNPTLGGDYDYYPERYVGFEDNGGVHWNSGIANLAFYLMSEGGVHPRGKTSVVVSPLDAADNHNSLNMAAAIFYRANTVYLTPSSTFSDARGATVNAAADLFDAAAVAVVEDAWEAVGVSAPPDYTVIDTQANLAGTTGDETRFSYQTPAGATHIKFEISGGTGDSDLYVKFGSEPTRSSYDCRPYRSGNAEICEFFPAQAGTYHVMLHAYSSYSGVTLTVSAAGAGDPEPDPEVCDDGQDNDGDGAIDCADSDCAADPVCQAPPDPEVCDDGQDNDGDGAIDCADSDCAADPVCQAPPSGDMHVGDIDGSTASVGNRWNATVTVQVVDGAGIPVSNATVSGIWTGAQDSSDSCTTDANGRCSVTTGNLRRRATTVNYKVEDVAHASLSYDSNANSDPDGDSDGNAITLLRP